MSDDCLRCKPLVLEQRGAVLEIKTAALGAGSLVRVHVEHYGDLEVQVTREQAMRLLEETRRLAVGGRLVVRLRLEVSS